jgi:hypothetical protein
VASVRSREFVALAFALVAHAWLFALAPKRPPPALPSAPPQPEAPADPFDVAFEPAPEKASVPAKATEAPRAIEEARPMARIAAPSVAERPLRSFEQPPPAVGPVGERAGEEAGPSKPPGDEYGSPAGGDSIGLPPGLGAPIWALPGVLPSASSPSPAKTVAPPPRPVDPDVAGKVLVGSLRTKDKDIGIEIPGAGVVATTLADAVRSGGPLDARATFEVDLGADGRVEGIRLVRASAGDEATWNRVVSAARSALASRSLQMGGDGKGAKVIVKIESSVEYPAGSKAAMVIQPICANEVFEQIEAMIKDVSQTGRVRGINDDAGNFIPYSSMTDEQRRRFCIPIGIRGKVDPSNIGAHATNVVRPSFQVVRAGEKALPAEAARPVDTRVPWAPVDPTKSRPPAPAKKKKKKRVQW